MSSPSLVQSRSTRSPSSLSWWGFAPFGLVAAVHIIALLVGVPDLARPTKLLLMPALIFGVLWSLRRTARWRTTTIVLLLIALVFSWLGDGAGDFFRGLPTLPMMLGCFVAAHLCYIRLFARHLAVRPFPRGAWAYTLWWVALLVILWPHLGGLAIPVALYGLVLGATAATATRCTPLIAVGAVLFLSSDTLLAFLLFTPDAMPSWSNALVMLTYCAGQLLIAAGVVRAVGVHTGAGR